jgi:hypothetical protein
MSTASQSEANSFVMKHLKIKWQSYNVQFMYERWYTSKVVHNIHLLYQLKT